MMKNILIAAHDAGSANHLKFLRKDKHSNYLYYLAGPARHIFGDVDNVVINLEDTLETVDLVISGTGWETNFEYDAIKLAREKKIKVIALLDHWTNYRDRFIRNDEEILPDEVWVFDKYALKLATTQFSGTPIILKENRYLKKQVQEIKKNEITQNKKYHLFLMEPLGVCPRSGKILEFEAFDYFIESFTQLKLDRKKILIKPHPSDKSGKYSCFPGRYPSFHIEVASNHYTLAELISNADSVIGCQTYAMVVALHAEKNVISVMPKSVGDCILPYKKILHAHKITENFFQKEE